MDKFKFEKSVDSNVTKSIRFPEQLDSRICEIVDKANKGKKKKEYSFNRICCECLFICNREYGRVKEFYFRTPFV